MNRTKLLIGGGGVLALLAGCATVVSDKELDAKFHAMLKGSFRSQGIAGVERLDQDPGQAACSTGQPVAAEVAATIQQEALASVRPPDDGQYLGDWREGEKLAQNGRGMTWSDKSADPSANGGSCYNCHQIGKAEISYGTIGPSLYQYGKQRGVADPASANSAGIVQYTWGKINNAWAYNACSNMPRFGHEHLLDQKQIKDLMALLLDPKSPVNAD